MYNHPAIVFVVVLGDLSASERDHRTRLVIMPNAIVSLRVEGIYGKKAKNTSGENVVVTELEAWIFMNIYQKEDARNDECEKPAILKINRDPKASIG